MSDKGWFLERPPKSTQNLTLLEVSENIQTFQLSGENNIQQLLELTGRFILRPWLKHYVRASRAKLEHSLYELLKYNDMKRWAPGATTPPVAEP